MAGPAVDSKHAGIIFDLDGTLIESSIDFQLMRERVFEVLRNSEIPEDLIDTREMMSVNVLRALKFLEANRSENDVTVILHRINMVSDEVELLGVEGTKPIPGVCDAVMKLRGNGYRLGILTRSSRNYAKRTLWLTGIDEMFEGMVCRDDHDFREAKPHPVSLQRAAAILGLSPYDCIYVGDHHMDQDCAEAAGSAFIGVLSGANDVYRWSSKRPEMIIGSVADLPTILKGNGR